MRSCTLDAIKKNKIIAIMRKVEFDRLIPAAEALYNGGIRLMEVTFDQEKDKEGSGTARAIKALTSHFGERALIGAGTVMDKRQVEIAIDAGARFTISPNTDAGVIKRTVEFDAISIPGALTPTEIAHAYSCGADYVKVFPAGNLGIAYLKAIKAPLSHIPFIAVGGIDEHNISDYLRAGAAGVGIGSNMVDNSLINQERYGELSLLAKKYTLQI